MTDTSGTAGHGRDIDELYQQVIIEHNRHPRNFGALEPHTHRAEGYNPLCGDHLFVSLNIDEQGTIQAVSFEGDGCAISKASASLMTMALKGKKIEEARMLFDEFRRLILKEMDAAREPNHLGKLTVFSGVWKYPSRVKCAILAWHTMKGALDNAKTVSTE
ncbi:MAG: SUF system NifU family Fe-S cluster assembly protein [Candidatus Omnitrophica bacterium]|nr:SUF system NifU family Fe-S cluster assembly protein [Candidatus Omnitrophota bacterium]